MGWLTGLVIYKVGKRRGRKKAIRSHEAPVTDTRDPKCINYESFCRGYGSCYDLECEYE